MPKLQVKVAKQEREILGVVVFLCVFLGGGGVDIWTMLSLYISLCPPLAIIIYIILNVDTVMHLTL